MNELKKRRVELSHGGGGVEMNNLIRKVFFKHFENDILVRDEDAARLQFDGPVAFTTDSFTVSPRHFNGGDLGKIAIAGTVNDLAMAGAIPQYLSCGFIIEEGLEFAELESLVQSMAAELAKSGAKIVCGDTKVVPKGAADGLFINTSGVGTCIAAPSWKRLEAGDAIIVSRDIGAHGACILASREGLELDTELQSDCDTLWPAVKALLDAGIDTKAMRDATRGGLAAVLNEWAEARELGIEVAEQALPIDPAVQGLCELFGFEPAELANEGTFVVAVAAEQAEQAVAILQQFQSTATVIGKVCNEYAGKVVQTSPWGSKRYMELPKGELLPRIC
ncbi:hydrogenase expression/formation protein HypE [Ferrimonas lipolytica]|uniref:Hydrogenase expression/formation protein HypE n=1 Tax=Ferrimonas lipolytica TaxID=2724191 RepID=A0A6H1UJD2_9GAMM|nr:hydrogenase expression/formation protein HypE [Ferrimonas lipolytica]QIZ78720.1 hydrogenase expression/formation protein HypE [Ferrimonas lipolytica]